MRFGPCFHLLSLASWISSERSACIVVVGLSLFGGEGVRFLGFGTEPCGIKKKGGGRKREKREKQYCAGIAREAPCPVKIVSCTSAGPRGGVVLSVGRPACWHRHQRGMMTENFGRWSCEMSHSLLQHLHGLLAGSMPHTLATV